MDEHCWHEERIKTSMSFGTHPGNMVRHCVPRHDLRLRCRASACTMLVLTAAPNCEKWAYVCAWGTLRCMQRIASCLAICGSDMPPPPLRFPAGLSAARTLTCTHPRARTHRCIRTRTSIRATVSKPVNSRERLQRIPLAPCELQHAICNGVRRWSMQRRPCPAAASAWSCSRRRRGTG